MPKMADKETTVSRGFDRRKDPLWGQLFNSIPTKTSDGRLLLFSRRALMADAAYDIAMGSPQDAG